MACEKYADWLTECALGELPASRQSEIMGHVRDCAVCRDALERAQQAAKLVDEGMKLLVGGEPSPQFAARLRSRIADESRIGAAWTRRVAVAGSVVLCLALVGVAAMRYLKRGPELAPQPSVSAVSSGAVNKARPASATVATTGARGTRKTGLHQRMRVLARPEVLVEPGQLAALDRFYEALQRYQAAGARAIALRDDSDQPMNVEPIAVKPLGVQPIKMPTVSSSTDSWPGF
jgi:hypothetical protein